MGRPSICWIFDELPPSGARRGGEPAEHAFKHDLGTFVREVIQNANDQAEGYPKIDFRFIELSGEELDAFFEALSFKTLEPHLRGASTMPGGRGLSAYLDDLREKGRLLLLRIEDKNTVGLTGEESAGDSHFRALCKDTLFSHKRGDTAGGSYGLGKSVLWSFSGLGAVLFHSVLLEEGPGQTSPRLIGRVELPSHPTRRRGAEPWFTGSGWFGRRTRLPSGFERAESVWARDAERRAQALHLARSPRFGTSILIVGFRDPTADETDDVATLVRRIEAATLEYFWPAMLMETRRLEVSAGTRTRTHRIEATERSPVHPFLDAYRRRADAGPRLAEPGDLVTRRISVHIPPMRGAETEGVTAEADLVVRLAHDGAGGPHVGHVALFRGPGMVLRYWDRRNLVLGMRPFHAILVTGRARNPRAPSPSDMALEAFLRTAEPPGHDVWESTPELKRTYKRGYQKSLRKLESDVTRALRELLAPRFTHGKKGPDRLQRRFPIGPRGSREGASSAFHVKKLDARFDGHRWHFGGEIVPEKAHQPWRIQIHLETLGEDGLMVDTLPIAAVDLDGASALTRLEAGRAFIEVEGGVRSLPFQGESGAVDVTREPAGALGIQIAGELVASAGEAS